MNSNTKPPILPRVPDVYEREFFQRVLQDIIHSVESMSSPGLVRAQRINVSNLPTSATGLRVGDLWNDSGTIKVVT